MKNPISEFLNTRIEARDFPSAVYLVAEKGEVVLQDALGLAVVEPEKIEAKIDTIYDLASLTKVLVTGLLCAKLIENNQIRLTDKVAEYFSEFETDDKREITLENLLAHTSGFPAWKPFYLSPDAPPVNTAGHGGGRDETINEFVLKEIGRAPLENPIGAKVIYSDFNFLTLGFLLERLYGKTLAEVAESEIFEPLGLNETFFNPPAELQKRIAASESGNEHEKNTCLQMGYEIPDPRLYFRDRIIWGEVHDGNCYYLNGASGHAGLFSTAAETFKIAQQFLANQTTLLRPETCELFQTDLTPKLNEARSVAFQMAATPESTASKALSPDSFGHLGFTGTSVWIEPATERIFILLTNRTHARELPFVNINSSRRKFHELATEILGK